MTRFAGLVLAAGTASRYRAAGGNEASKVVARHEGEALVGRVARAALAAKLDPVLVVTGHAAEIVEASVAGYAITIVRNPDFASGLASSLRCGIGALPADVDGAVVLLADMPLIEAPVIDQLVEAARKTPDADAVVPTWQGERGNPVLLRRDLFGRVAGLAGDTGARALFRTPGVVVFDLEIENPSVRLDVDTPADLPRSA